MHSGRKVIIKGFNADLRNEKPFITNFLLFYYDFSVLRWRRGDPLRAMYCLCYDSNSISSFLFISLILVLVCIPFHFTTLHSFAGSFVRSFVHLRWPYVTFDAGLKFECNFRFNRHSFSNPHTHTHTHTTHVRACTIIALFGGGGAQ